MSKKPPVVSVALRWRISWSDSIGEELTDVEAILLTPRWS